MKDENKDKKEEQILTENEMNEVNGGKDYTRIRFEKKMEDLEHLKY